MKICIISDTHGQHDFIGINSYSADTIIHCGDISGNGKINSIQNFLNWFSNLNQFKHKIFIAGNHDLLFEKSGIIAREIIPNNIIYLEDNEVIIDDIKFYGSPVQKHFNNWAFNRDETKLAQHWAAIPENTDILITHSPPLGIGDFVPWANSHEGSPSLHDEVINRIKPKIHCFGHIHEGYGLKIINNIKFVNASNLNGNYEVVNNPFIFNL